MLRRLKLNYSLIYWNFHQNRYFVGTMHNACREKRDCATLKKKEEVPYYPMIRIVKRTKMVNSFHSAATRKTSNTNNKPVKWKTNHNACVIKYKFIRNLLFSAFFDRLSDRLQSKCSMWKYLGDKSTVIALAVWRIASFFAWISIKTTILERFSDER